MSWPAGLVWSTDPDGGVAPSITGTALVSLFTVGGVTRAILGATFPGVSAPDTTAPAWSATLTTGTPAATSVVVAASALATDAVGVTGYERSLDGGSTWAAITPSGLNFTLTGLTAATSYPAPRFRAKDAAGNVSAVLTAQAFTTASGGDVTNPTPGTLASSAITSSGFTLTVSGASDAGGLHATPYAYSTDNGSTWSAWQAGATYNATGLAASTAYQVRHKVRDAAGNEATGTAVTVTTSSDAITLVSDDFNRADSSTGLGTATTGQLWVNSSGIIGIVSNEAKKISGTGLVSLIEVGQRDMYVSVLTVGDTNGGHGLYARYTDADNYYAIDTGSDGLGPKLIGRMGGVDVNVRVQRKLVMGDRFGIRVKDRTGGGAVVELLVNNMVVDTWDHADSTIVGTKAGIRLNTGYANLRYDNFTVTSA